MSRRFESSTTAARRPSVRRPILRLLILLLALLLPAALLSQQPPNPLEPAPQPAAEAAVEEEAAVEGAAAEEQGEPPAAGPAEPEPADAVGRAVAVVPTSVDDVREGTERAWNEYLIPLWDKTLETAPRVLSAIGVLLLFWLIAVILGWTVTRLLNMTELDNRLAKDLGMQDRLQQWEEDGTSLEKMAGTATKWVVLLFGLVAFFQTLQLTMVAGPLGDILDQVTDFVPALLKAFAYLALYWVVGTLLKMALTRGLTAVGFDERAGRWIKPREVKGEVIGPSAMVGRLVFYVVLLFGLPHLPRGTGSGGRGGPSPRHDHRVLRLPSQRGGGAHPGLHRVVSWPPSSARS